MSQPGGASLTPDRIAKGIVRLQRCIERVYQWDPSANAIETVKAEATALSAAVAAALTQTFGAGTGEFRRYAEATAFHYPLSMVERVPDDAVRKSLRKCRETSLKLLQEAKTFLEQEQEFLHDTPVAAGNEPGRKPSAGNVVIGDDRIKR